MAQRWDEPTKKALPGPVPMEERSLTVEQREELVAAVASRCFAHGLTDCRVCPTYDVPVAFPSENTPGGSSA